MNLEGIKAIVTSRTARQVLLTKKHSPTILLVAGTVGVIGTVVLACRATLKVSDVLDVAEGGKAILDAELTEGKTTKEDHGKALRKIQLKGAVEIAKLYAPAVGLGALSIGALTGSHVILSKRNSAIMAAYAGLDRAHKSYRQRVTNEFGKDVDRKFALGAEKVVVEEKTAEGGIKTTTKDVVTNERSNGRSPYAALFDASTTRHFSREPGMNPHILEMKQNQANDKLRAYGHLFLNEVYDILGLPRSKAGAVVGWIYDPKNPEHEGDNYVTFGIFDNTPEIYEAFVDGDHKFGIWLDFNVDGVIYDKI